MQSLAKPATQIPYNVPALTPIHALCCTTPGCRRKRGHGLFSRFCPRCAKRLAAIRDQLQAELEATKRYGGITTIAGTNGVPVRRKRGVPICTNPYCQNEREHGHSFCDVCVTEGYMEDAA